MIVKCPYCKTELDLAVVGGRCSSCDAVFEVYYDWDRANEVARVYNEQTVPADPPAMVCSFEDANGWVVFFRDEHRLAEVARRLL
jgi:hypothetical protein